MAEMKRFKMGINWYDVIPTLIFLLVYGCIFYTVFFFRSCSQEKGELTCFWTGALLVGMGTWPIILMFLIVLQTYIIRKGNSFICVDDKKVYFPKFPVSFIRSIELKKISKIYPFKDFRKFGFLVRCGIRFYTFSNIRFENEEDLIPLAKALARDEKLELPDLEKELFFRKIIKK